MWEILSCLLQKKPVLTKRSVSSITIQRATFHQKNICQTSEMLLTGNIYMSIEKKGQHKPARLVTLMDTKTLCGTTQRGYPNSHQSY